MKIYRVLSVLLAITFVTQAFAQHNHLSDADRTKWLSEIREYKHSFIANELELTREQQRDFFPLYDSMEDEIERVNAETRAIETRLAVDEDASDLELENGARTVFEQKRAEGQIEMTYFDKFREILTPRQLIKLKNSERRFTQQLVQKHRRMAGRKSKEK